MKTKKSIKHVLFVYWKDMVKNIDLTILVILFYILICTQWYTTDIPSQPLQIIQETGKQILGDTPRM
jgi:hypothetical protein